MPPRTIDNLGVEVSSRYAKDQEILDQALIKEARAIPVQTQIDVTVPFFPSEIESLLHAQPTHLPWAMFIAPSKYFEQKKRLFTFQLIPSMGSEDKKESQAQKILTKLNTLYEERLSKGEVSGKQQENYPQNLEEEEKGKKSLTSLLHFISFYDQLIIEINSKRGQYQKG